jgi:predicted GIY-YIG superfamily endonuclease
MIYILEFEQPLGNARHAASYYIGYCEEGRLEDRLQQHRSGGGAAITRACVERGIGFEVIITLPGDRSKERQLKRRKNTPRLVRQIKRGIIP